MSGIKSARSQSVSPAGKDEIGLKRDIVQRGLEIAPVPLNLNGKSVNLVGKGSYLVNAVAGCNDCHTNPSYAVGGNPFMGQTTKVNAQNYLAGGMHFGPFVSANITPDSNGLPAGLTADEFLQVLRTGQDPDQAGQLLQVMPWPTFHNMTDKDIRSIYEYLSSIPHAEPATN
ncbi:MAG: c-type cytochrome [Blastocatellia bacterium]